MRNDTISSLALKKTCYILLRNCTDWWLNIRRHIKLAPTPQHLKQEKGKGTEKKGEKKKLATCENWREKGCLIFRFLGGAALAEDFEPDIFGIPQLENSWLWNPTFAYLKDRQGMLTRPLQGKLAWASTPEGEWNCLIRTVTQYKWFVWDDPVPQCMWNC